MLGNSSNPLAAGILEMIHNHPGGISGLVQSFHQQGLGELVNSWISTGQNLPISADQLQQVLGSERVQQLASRVGISPDQAGSQLAQILPTIVDKLTPNGNIEQGNLLEMGMNLLKSLGSKSTAA
jgi:uncharacterized protein YidB (DUF937 family)